jgi:hypothetical protein
MLILDIKDEFSSLNSQLFGLSVFLSRDNYFPFLRAKQGHYSGSTETIEIAVLQKLLPEYKLTGFFAEYQEERFVEFVKKPLALFASDNKQVEYRVQLLLNILRVYFYEKTVERKIFFYHQDVADYFADTSYWSLCFFILLKNEFVLVYGKTWKFLADCPVEKEDKYNGRMLFKQKYGEY